MVLYGCPGEEGGAAKAFMARDGLWYGLDAALTWHPDDANEVLTGSSNSCIQTQYHFTGVAAHAAGDPDRGRSALDAVELMNVGVQFLREHMSDKARVHYAITDAGGRSPNVVQPREMCIRDREPLEETIDQLIEEIRSRHIQRLQAGQCTIQLGFVLSDLLTNIERASDHCSNIAVSVIEECSGGPGRHAYLQEVKAGGAFGEDLRRDRKKYHLPEA